MSSTTATRNGRGDKPGDRNRKRMEPVFDVVDLDTLTPAEEAFGDEFDTQLIGQPEAREIALEVRSRMNNPMRNKKFPLGIFLLVGKSRRGKSLLAQVLAKMLHGDDEALTRVTSEDYYDESQMNDLRGAPPKYVGHREPVDVRSMKREKLAQVDGYSKISEWNRIRVRLNSACEIDVVVIEEFSKSGLDFYKFWMEVFDKGKKTLANGELVDFTNTVFILTDNLGMDEVEKEEEGSSIGFGSGQKKVLSHEQITTIVQKSMRRRYKPEFRNRIDRMVVYRELSAEDTLKIVDINVQQLYDRIIDQMPRGDDFTMDVRPCARKFLLKAAEEDVANLKRVILQHVEGPLGRILAKDNPNRVLGGDLLRVTWDGKSEKLTFAIARGEGDVDENIEGLMRVLGDTSESMKGVAYQRRLSKLRGAMTRENTKEWAVTVQANDRDELMMETYTIQDELKQHYGLKISNMSINFEAPYEATIVVKATRDQMDMVSQQYGVTVKEMSRALVVVNPKKNN